MKKILLITLLPLIANSIFSQTNYYPDSIGSKIFNENGYTYQVNRIGRLLIEIYNKDNKWIGTTQIDSSTGEYPTEDSPVPLDINNYKVQLELLHSILEESYSNEEKEKIKETGWGGECIIEMYISSLTGKVDDVRFSFGKSSYYVHIPVSRFREIELKIKERLQFEVTDYGKLLNYIYYFNDYNFE